MLAAAVCRSNNSANFLAFRKERTVFSFLFFRLGRLRPESLSQKKEKGTSFRRISRNAREKGEEWIETFPPVPLSAS